MALAVALNLRHLDASLCSAASSTTSCALHDGAFAATYGLALVIGGVLSCIVAIFSRRPDSNGRAYMGRVRSMSWSFAAGWAAPLTVIAALNRPWLRDALVTTVIFLGIRSVLRVLAPELTGRTFDEVLASGREAFD